MSKTMEGRVYRCPSCGATQSKAGVPFTTKQQLGGHRRGCKGGSCEEPSTPVQVSENGSKTKFVLDHPFAPVVEAARGVFEIEYVPRSEALLITALGVPLHEAVEDLVRITEEASRREQVAHIRIPNRVSPEQATEILKLLQQALKEKRVQVAVNPQKKELFIWR